MKIRPAPRELLADMACAGCGSTDVFAIAPGAQERQALGLFPLGRGIPLRSWCLGCWRRSFAVRAAA